MKKLSLNTLESEVQDVKKIDLQRRIFTYSKEALKIAFTIDPIIINHPRFAQGMEALDRIYQLSHELNLPQGLRIIGPTGSGKTTLINYFEKTIPKTTLFRKGLGVVSIRLNFAPNRHQLVRNLLMAYDYPFTTISTKAIDIKIKNLCEIMIQKGTRILVIGDSHYMALISSKKNVINNQNDVSDTLHYLMDTTGIGLVLCGSEELDNLESIDAHLASRVSARLELCDYIKPNPEWYGLLKAFVNESKLFDLSLILTENYGALIHAATKGNFRNLKRLISELILICVDEKPDQITKNQFQLAHDRIYGEDSDHANPFN